MASAVLPSREPGGELVIVRILDAPRERVFRAWTEAEQVMRWWGPRDFTMPFCSVDARVGGSIRSCMRSPDGQEIWSLGVIREIVPPERLLVLDSFSDAGGNVVEPSAYGMAEWPREALIETTFAEIGLGTELTVVHHVPIRLAERYGARRGWGETLDRLAEFLSEESDVFLGGERAERDVIVAAQDAVAP